MICRHYRVMSCLDPVHKPVLHHCRTNPFVWFRGTQDSKEDLITWVFEDNPFVPQVKIQNGKFYSIVTEHLGTYCMALDENG